MAEKAPPNQGTSTGMIQRGISLEDNLARQISEIEVLKSILSDDMLVIRENQELKVTLNINLFVNRSSIIIIILYYTCLHLFHIKIIK